MKEVIIFIVVIVTSFIWRNRNRNSNRSTILFIIETCFVFIAVFQLCFHLICVMMILLPFFLCFRLQHLLFFILNLPIFIHNFKKRMYTRLISNGEQTLSKNYFYFIFYSSSPPPTTHNQFHPFSAFPSLLFLSKIQKYYKKSLKLDT
jgi:hypothetical protein